MVHTLANISSPVSMPLEEILRGEMPPLGLSSHSVFVEVTSEEELPGLRSSAPVILLFNSKCLSALCSLRDSAALTMLSNPF